MDELVVLHPPTIDQTTGMWYVVSVDPFATVPYRYYYLHDDGELKSYCSAVPAMPDSSGYYSTIDAAWEAATKYYEKFNEVYPYALVTAEDGSKECIRISDRFIEFIRDKVVVESKVMEFE
jgi:hypothetical protein